MAKTHMVLGTLVEANGFHPAAWLTEEAEPDAPTNVEWHQRMAQLAERGLLDFFFIADTPATRTDNLTTWSRAPMYMNQLEPITLLTAIAGATKHIGLGGTASTSFYEPYNIARLYASLDHISGGRAAWNVVTSANDYAARNFGLDRLPPHAKRYDKAREFLTIVKRLWDTWEDDAFIMDKERCLTFDPDKYHVVDHDGEFFKIHGGLNIARPPQGHPVIIQAGASETGKEFAAETSEVIFGTGADIEAAKRFYADLKGRMGKYGRTPDQLKVLAGITVVVGESAADAHAKLDGWNDLVHTDVGLMRLRNDLETDLSDLPLDEPVPVERIPATSNHHQAYFNEIAGMIREGLTLRDICRRYNRSKAVFAGSPMEVADMMETWVTEQAADGFMMTFPVLPSTMAIFVEKVVPELQRRGLFRTEYEGKTFRENLGLARPENSNLVAERVVETV